jgi:hypothetical protein
MMDKADNTFYTQYLIKKKSETNICSMASDNELKARLSLLPLVSLTWASDLFALLLMALIALHQNLSAQISR